MKIQKIISEHGEQPGLCRGGGCPAALLTEDHIFIQGYIPSDREQPHLSTPDGESFVKMPRATFEKIARQILNN